MPLESERDRLHAARCRLLFTVLYLGSLRAADVAAETRMDVFSPSSNRNERLPETIVGLGETIAPPVRGTQAWEAVEDNRH